MKLVRQEDPEGCGVAVFAMLTEQSYAEAAAELGFDGEAVNVNQLFFLLQRHRFFLRRIWSRSETPNNVWPPPPFAPMHFAIVTQSSGGGHFVVMDAEGTVFDPLDPRPRRLDEWSVVHEVVGLLRPPQ